MSLDYSKWDVMEDEIDAEEKAEKERRRAENREKYYKEQADKKIKFMKEEMRKAEAQGKDPQEVLRQLSGHGGHGHGHSHSDHHDHDHGESVDSLKAQPQPPMQLPPRTSCGCGFVDPEELKRIAAARAAAGPEPTLDEKNVKKLRAIQAAKEDGNRFFKEGKYEQAEALFERGVLIANGTYGLDDDDFKLLQDLEMKLDLNLSACKLKKKDWVGALDNAKMALNIDKKCAKGYFRQGQGYMGLEQWDKAKQSLMQAAKLKPQCRDTRKLLAQVKAKKKEEKEKVRRAKEALSKKMTQDQDRQQLQTSATETDSKEQQQQQQQQQQEQESGQQNKIQDTNNTDPSEESHQPDDDIAAQQAEMERMLAEIEQKKREMEQQEAALRAKVAKLAGQKQKK